MYAFLLAIWNEIRGRGVLGGGDALRVVCPVHPALRNGATAGAGRTRSIRPARRGVRERRIRGEPFLFGVRSGRVARDGAAPRPPGRARQARPVSARSSRGRAGASSGCG